MKNLFLILSLSFLFSLSASSQGETENIEAINNYKYIVVPLRYELFKNQDEYQINSLTEFLFNKYGYTAFLESDTYPDDLNQNRCLALKTEVVKVKGGFLNTKLQINLMDCNGNLVASSKVGASREKEYKTAYNFALRDAFETFQHFTYNYKPDPKVVALSASASSNSSAPNTEQVKAAQDEIERLKQEVAALKEEQETEELEIQPVVKTSAEKVEQPKELVKDNNTLFAQPIEHGFQVVDLTPKVIMILLATPKQNTYIVKDQNAIVFKEDGFWYLSKNDGKSTSLETLNIKF
ncbi:hypothetical protein [Psychroserpens sp.]|uniref:hypothetical protein n=1 Tax=Psychroserpens sp. TaxID=2020870 RepID=UPI002B26E799|nr:hypothetical protein [Psychroserpens sp.]